MKQHLCGLALLLLVAVLGAACGGSEPTAPESGSTPAATDMAPATSPTQADSTPAAMGTPSTIAATQAGPTSALADPPSTTATAQTETTPPMAGAPSSIYESLLQAIPDSPEAREYVFINDYDLVRRMFDIPLPGPDDGDDALETFYSWSPPFGYDPDNPTPVIQFGGFSLFGMINQMSNISDNLQYLAFDMRNVDQTIVTGEGRLDNAMDVVRGRFDPEATDKALAACSECQPPSREEHRGVTHYGWGEDYARDTAMEFAPPAFDRSGRGGRLAVLDEYVLHTFGSTEMRALIDVNLNEVPSLADVEEFRLLAGGMSELEAYVMLLTDGSGGYDMSVEGIAKSFFDGTPSQSEIEEQKQRLTEVGGPLLRPFDAYATGAGIDENGPYMALTLVHADDASAEENAGLLGRKIGEGTSLYAGLPWSESIDIETSEVRAEGRVLTAKLRGDMFRYWLDWVIQRDGLIMHE